MKPEIGVRLIYERTFNLGNFNSKKIGIEINGDVKEVEKYKDIEVMIKEIVKQMEKTVNVIKDDE
jgi:hypothetical protein